MEKSQEEKKKRSTLQQLGRHTLPGRHGERPLCSVGRLAEVSPPHAPP